MLERAQTRHASLDEKLSVRILGHERYSFNLISEYPLTLTTPFQTFRLLVVFVMLEVPWMKQ